MPALRQSVCSSASSRHGPTGSVDLLAFDGELTRFSNLVRPYQQGSEIGSGNALVPRRSEARPRPGLGRGERRDDGPARNRSRAHCRPGPPPAFRR